MSILRKEHLGSILLAAAGTAAIFFAGCSGNSGSMTPHLPTAGLPASASGSSTPQSKAENPIPSYTFTTLDDQADPTFNQLLGINDNGVISGYFGIGSPGHPNKGYVLNPPYGQGNYVNENFPGSVQTQVTAIDGTGNTAGFWAGPKNNNFGFVEWNGVFTSYRDPKTPVKGGVNQLLGLNSHGIAVGFYNDAKGNSHAYTLNQATGVFTPVKVTSAVSTVATGINNNGDITGLYKTTANGATNGFLIKDGKITTFGFPGGSNTQPFGINIHDTIVGSYLDGAGVMHGFVLRTPLKGASWQSIDDPNGVGSTVVNGLNDQGDLVGFYTDAAGNTDGMLAMP